MIRSIEMRAPGRYRLLGSTVDDAAGEAFDKVARYLGLGYPGGPVIDLLAATGDRSAIRFPRGLLNEGLDFSFSGMKTAVVNYVRKHPDADNADLSAGFQEAVVDVLVTKALRAAASVGAASVCLGGGVAANSRLREVFAERVAEELGVRIYEHSKATALERDGVGMIVTTPLGRVRSDRTRFDRSGIPRTAASNAAEMTSDTAFRPSPSAGDDAATGTATNGPTKVMI